MYTSIITIPTDYYNKNVPWFVHYVHIRKQIIYHFCGLWKKNVPYVFVLALCTSLQLKRQILFPDKLFPTIKSCILGYFIKYTYVTGTRGHKFSIQQHAYLQHWFPIHKVQKFYKILQTGGKNFNSFGVHRLGNSGGFYHYKFSTKWHGTETGTVGMAICLHSILK